MTTERPKVVIIAGPNGAGKSTAAGKLLLGPLGVREFVNADVIAQGLSAFAPESAAFEAGRIMLQRLKQLAALRASFALETTLAARTYARWLTQLQSDGYEVHLYFFWLPSADMAVARVAERVRSGGHHIPEETIRRRYVGGLVNLQRLYIPIADSWYVFDNTRSRTPPVIAEGKRDKMTIYIEEAWQSIIDAEG